VGCGAAAGAAASIASLVRAADATILEFPLLERSRHCGA